MIWWISSFTVNPLKFLIVCHQTTDFLKKIKKNNLVLLINISLGGTEKDKKGSQKTSGAF